MVGRNSPFPRGALETLALRKLPGNGDRPLVALFIELVCLLSCSPVQYFGKPSRDFP